MFERGKRKLPALALKRLSSLIGVTATEDRATTFRPTFNANEKERLVADVTYNRALANRLAKKLALLDAQYFSLAQTDALLQQLELMGNTAWLSLERAIIRSRLKECSNSDRLLLRCRIEALLTKAQVIEQELARSIAREDQHRPLGK